MSRILSYRDAINEAMAEEMRRDPAIFVYGIDVNDTRRIFGSTTGLVEEFGKERCFNTPLAEDSMTGFGLGAAINGKRPIHVHIRVDFLILAMNQIANMIATHHYGSGGRMKVPMVIRAVIGRGWGQSFQHSKALQSWFAHIPGLKVIMPATPKDAKGMLIAAIRDDNPVICLEHRWLYDIEDQVPDDCADIGLTGSQVLHEGDDISIIATSWMVVEAMHAAKILAKQGLSAEVVDCRSIAPFDESEVIHSVEKTGRAIVADNDWQHCGFGAEVGFRIQQQCFGRLKSPVLRLGFAATPCPCTRPLEDAFYPNAGDIALMAAHACGRPSVDLSGETFYSHENKFKGPF